MKFLLWALVIAWLWWWWAAKRRPRAVKPPVAQPAAVPEAMVRCARCDLILPRSEALPDPAGERHYCSEAHRRLHG